MIEFKLQDGQRCAVNPKLITAIVSRSESPGLALNQTLICFGADGVGNSDFIVTTPYKAVLYAIQVDLAGE